MDDTKAIVLVIIMPATSVVMRTVIRIIMEWGNHDHHSRLKAIFAGPSAGAWTSLAHPLLVFLRITTLAILPALQSLLLLFNMGPWPGVHLLARLFPIIVAAAPKLHFKERQIWLCPLWPTSELLVSMFRLLFTWHLHSVGDFAQRDALHPVVYVHRRSIHLCPYTLGAKKSWCLLYYYVWKKGTAL